MWRFFRLGIKGGNCPGNHAHFRIIGTTCANADCDEKSEELSNLSRSGRQRLNGKENLASNATKKFQSYLQNQENISQKKVHQFEYIKPNISDKPLTEVNWEKYIAGKEKGSSNNVKLQNESNDHSLGSSDSKPDYNDSEFGSLTKDNCKFELLPEEKDIYQREVLLDRKSFPEYYSKRMLEFCKERKLKEALEILEVEMKELGVFPDSYCYTVLINGCGKLGYTKKAFDLYYQMKKRGLVPQKYTFTGLFNACANSPNGDTEGLSRATTLRKQIKDKQIQLHPITYHAMIKAFGRCGDIKTAFEIVDEMGIGGHAIKTETLNFLLQACISDKETGFRHALMVWRKMRSLLLVPDIYSYNLLLRCVKECGAGDPQLLDRLFYDANENLKLQGKLKGLRETTVKSLKAQLSNEKKIDSNVMRVSLKNQRKEKKIEAEKIFYQVGDKNEIVKVNLEENMEMELVNRDMKQLEVRKEVLPNMLAYKVDPGSLLSITSLEKRDERLWLLGGVSGLLQSMMKDRVKPTCTSFTFLLESLPPQKDVEEMLFTTMEKCKVEPNIIFFNKLIHKRSMRGDYAEAKDVLDLMHKHNVSVDLITFGCLALGCTTPSQMHKFLREMTKAGFSPNEEIFETLLKNCMVNREYVCAVELLQKLKHYEVTPTETMITRLELLRSRIKKRFIEQETEQGELSPREQRKREEMRIFLMEYKYWLKNSRVHFKDHPWAQFGYQDKGKEVVKQTST